MKTKEKTREIKYIDIKVAKKIHKQLEKMLEKADHKKVFEYNIDAHSDFCADVVLVMDIMIGQIVKKYKK